MKKILLASLVFSSLVFPSFSHAQFAPFGGLDDAILPYCTCTPEPEVLSCANPLPTPPNYIFHVFAPLWIVGAMVGGGLLGVPIEDFAMAFPQGVLAPGMWAIGELIPTPPNPLTTCGIYINTIDDCPEGVIAGLCIPIWPATGVITPFTGTGSAAI